MLEENFCKKWFKFIKNKNIDWTDICTNSNVLIEFIDKNPGLPWYLDIISRFQV